MRLVAEDMAPGESLPGTLGDVVNHRELNGKVNVKKRLISMFFSRDIQGLGLD